MSDAHVLPAGELQHGAVDTFANLEAALSTVAASGVTASALLLTGDLTDDGSPAAYRRLRDLVEPAAERLGARLIYLMGNHDERAAFRRELLSTEGTTEPHDAVHWVGGLRIIVLDTTTPHRHDGRLEPAQLDWLRAELAQPALHGTILALHHPPLPSAVPPVHLLRLHDAERLGEVIAGTDVRIILCGHNHATGCGALAGVPVWVSPACANQIDPLATGRLRGVPGSGLSRIDVFGRTVTATAVRIETPPPVYDLAESAALSRIRSNFAEFPLPESE
ncbi:metallophosphoesterase [Saccharopolyspora indica]|uniref:metallophosphoesterase n=1 Tax=Saccharopolyspora indica TaxID=1229659 RepID=UPI0022EA8887|nr:metallophosphoesterase [Saccharopolyspora indica]MDA3648394.1 metallophosphoesterase [Saccharopolyspora indica]